MISASQARQIQNPRLQQEIDRVSAKIKEYANNGDRLCYFEPHPSTEDELISVLRNSGYSVKWDQSYDSDLLKISW